MELDELINKLEQVEKNSSVGEIRYDPVSQRIKAIGAGHNTSISMAFHEGEKMLLIWNNTKRIIELLNELREARQEVLELTEELECVEKEEVFGE